MSAQHSKAIMVMTLMMKALVCFQGTCVRVVCVMAHTPHHRVTTKAHGFLQCMETPELSIADVDKRGNSRKLSLLVALINCQAFF